MKQRIYYVRLAALGLLGVVAIAAAPQPTLAVLTLAVPASIAAAGVSTLYLRRVFSRQPVPRSRFFRMLLESFWSLLMVGAWVGYLTIGRLTERAHEAGQLSWNLPVPAPHVSSPISALVVVLVFATPVRFALEVYRERRRATLANTGERVEELDRETPEQ